MITTRPGAAILRDAIVAILRDRGALTALQIREALKERGHAGANVPTNAALRVLAKSGAVERLPDGAWARVPWGQP